MDVVITYVDGLDPLWLRDYSEVIGEEPMAKRFRDWGTLKYLLRGIEVNIPFVRNVYLVVARDSQVPDWVDRDKLHVVLHSDIIPEEFLPVFNASSIEMFLHRIPGLDEQFVYLNDDFFPMRPCTPDTFFPEGKANIGMKRQLLVAGNDFRFVVRRGDAFAREAAGKRRTLSYLRPQHICYAMLRSGCDELYGKYKERIHSSVTPLRTRANYNIYLFLDYIHYTGRSVNRRMSKKHFSLAVADIEKICSFIIRPTRDFVCINDVRMTDEKYRLFREELLAAFENKFPEKSSYEL